MVQALIRWKHVGALERPGGWCHHALVNRCRSLWRRRRTEAAFVAHERGRVASSPGPSEGTGPEQAVRFDKSTSKWTPLVLPLWPTPERGVAPDSGVREPLDGRRRCARPRRLREHDRNLARSHFGDLKRQRPTLLII
jgi:hypothetical protein